MDVELSTLLWFRHKLENAGEVVGIKMILVKVTVYWVIELREIVLGHNSVECFERKKILNVGLRQ